MFIDEIIFITFMVEDEVDNEAGVNGGKWNGLSIYKGDFSR